MDGERGTDRYALGYADEERQRLIEQGELIGHLSLRLRKDAGVAPGMRVLDVGCGVGAVSMLAASLVGPEGFVIGADTDPRRINFEPHQDAQTLIDGCYLVPGLVGAHAHLALASPVNGPAHERVRAIAHGEPAHARRVAQDRMHRRVPGTSGPGPDSAYWRPVILTEYLVVIEHGDPATNYSAYAPDLPGCVATGDTLEEVEGLMQKAVALHVASLREHGDPVPKPRASVRYIAG